MEISRPVRRHRLVLVAMACIAAVVPFGTSAVHADAAESVDALVSRDGITFAPDLEDGLFDRFELLVPGESLTANLWIRNPTADTASLRVGVRNVVISSSAYAGGIVVSSGNSASGSTMSQSLGRLAECETLMPPETIGGGETVTMAVTFTMRDLIGREGQGQSTAMDILVSMREAEAGPFPLSSCEDDGVLIPVASDVTERSAPSALGVTGARSATPLLAVASLLLGVGVAMIVGRRRAPRASETSWPRRW